MPFNYHLAVRKIKDKLIKSLFSIIADFILVEFSSDGSSRGCEAS